MYINSILSTDMQMEFDLSSFFFNIIMFNYLNYSTKLCKANTCETISFPHWQQGT